MLRIITSRWQPQHLILTFTKKQTRITLFSTYLKPSLKKCSRCGQGILSKSLLNVHNTKLTINTLAKNNIASQQSRDVWRLLSLARPEKWKIGGAVVLLLVFSSISMSVPYFIGKIIDIMYTSKDEHASMLSNLRTICFTLSGVFLLGACANVGRLYMIQSAGQKIIQRLRSKTFSAIISQEMAFFDRTSSGELINRLSSDTTLVGKAVTDNVSDGLRATVQAIGGISLMVYTSPKLATVALFIVPPVVLFAGVYGRFVRKITRGVQDKLAASSQIAEERFSNIKTVRAFAQEHNEMKVYNEKVQDVYHLARKEALARAAFFGFNGFSGNCIALLVLYNGGVMMADSLITVGDLTSFLMYTVYVGISISGLGTFYTELMKGLGASTRIWNIIDKQPAIPLSGGTQISEAIKDQSIQFENVMFSYPARPEIQILNNFQLHVPSGSVTAIVGESGSGKSTIGSLLLRHYDVNGGCIKIGHQDIRSFDPSSLREHIGTVNQEPILFSTTISKNIGYGIDNDVSDEEIHMAAKKSHAYEFVTSFPDGFETVVGERGQMLSGGQRQRIALARAILKDPCILLLDEATSALDAESEHLVQDALQKLMRDRTTIIIAHRLSTIKTADQIAVLRNGAVAEVGGYYELLKKENGLFRQLVEKQSFDNS